MLSNHRRGARALAALSTSVAVLGAAAPASHALALRATPGYTFVRIDHPRAASVTGPTTIAENGDIAGFYTDAAGRSHGFVRDAATGAFTDVDVPGARDTYALGLNAHGDVSGTFMDQAGAQHGFVRDGAASTRSTCPAPSARRRRRRSSAPASAPPSARSATTAPSSAGGAPRAGASHGFVQRPGQPRVDLDAPGASTAMDPIFQTEGGTGAIRSNARGDVVGYFTRNTHVAVTVDIRAYRLRDGVWKTLLPPGAFTSQAFALNEAGDVGGVAFGIDGLNGNGWIWQDGAFKRIDAAPLLLTRRSGTSRRTASSSAR